MNKNSWVLRFDKLHYYCSPLFQTTWVINMMVRNLTELETHIVSAERIKEYSEVPQEVRGNY